MAYNNYRNRNRNFGNNNRRFVGNQSVQVPNAPYIDAKDMSNTSDYNLRNKTRFDMKQNFSTVFEKVRSYDLVLDKAEVKIAGAAPIYGKLNSLKEWNFGDGVKGTFTGQLNQLYMDNKFSTLYAVSRDASFLYKGVDYTKGLEQDGLKNWTVNDDSLAARVDREGAAAILFELDAAKTFDMVISSVVPAETIDGEFYNISTPLMTILQQYQHELMLIMLYIATFDRMRATLPLLQSLDYNSQTLYAKVESELKRSRFTAKISSIKSTLKRRWVDKQWIKDIMLPFLVWSKKTDGLNSPILTLRPALITPITEFKLDPNASIKYRIPRWGITDNDVNKSVQRQVNFFDLLDLAECILVPQTIADKQTKVNQWIDTQYTQLQQLEAGLADWVNNPLVIAVETMLSKLATRPGSQGLSWQQNVSPNELMTFESFTDWEIVNSLVLNVNTLPTMDSNSNGYTISLPMYQYDGFDTQMIKEHFQYYYLHSNLTTIGFIRLGEIISNTFRDGHVTHIQVKPGTKVTQLEVTNKDGTKTTETADYASRVFQESYPNLTYHRVASDNSAIVNPQLMTFIPVRINNRAGDAVIWLKQIYLLPMA